MCRELDSIIVHEDILADTLQSVYDADPAKISVIPHGARDIPSVKDAKKKLQLDGKKNCFAGRLFQDRANALIEESIYSLSVVKRCPEANLVISGKMRMVEFSEHRNDLFDKIRNSSACEQIEVFRGQFPQDTFDTIVSASDIVAFPYDAGAQSGVMAHAFAFGKPIVCSKLPAFESIMNESRAGFTASTDEEYVDNIVKLLTDEELYKKCSENALRHVREKISWDIVAKRTLEIYKRFDSNFPRSRYIYEG